MIPLSFTITEVLFPNEDILHFYVTSCFLEPNSNKITDTLNPPGLIKTDGKDIANMYRAAIMETSFVKEVSFN